MDPLVTAASSEDVGAKQVNYTALDDHVLIEFAVQRDSHAIETLVQRYTPLLIGFLRGRVPRFYEDVYQETFALALAKLDTLRSRDKFGPWLLKIAQREIVNWARAEARQAASGTQDRVVRAASAWADTPRRDPLHDTGLEDAAQAIIDLILEQPEPYRLVLYLNLIHEKEPQTIAQELGLRPGTARMRLKRGLAGLRKALKRRGLG